jgi:hypothetical protein
MTAPTEQPHDKPYRVGRHWAVTIVHDPDRGEHTGQLIAVATNTTWAHTIVDALNTATTKEQ